MTYKNVFHQSPEALFWNWERTRTRGELVDPDLPRKMELNVFVDIVVVE